MKVGIRGLYTDDRCLSVCLFRLSETTGLAADITSIRRNKIKK